MTPLFLEHQVISMAATVGTGVLGTAPIAGTVEVAGTATVSRTSGNRCCC